METLTEARIETSRGTKLISVQLGDIRDLSDPVDIMTVSSFYRNYSPTRGTLLGALYDYGIDTRSLSRNPTIDLRDLCNIWLSNELHRVRLPIRRIACIEMSPAESDTPGHAQRSMYEQGIIQSIRAHFSMLDIATSAGIAARTLGMPILGGGNQGIPTELISIPVINECAAYLRRNEETDVVRVITRNQKQAAEFARRLKDSYAVSHSSADKRALRSAEADGTLGADAAPPTPLAFLSYSSRDKNIADNLCAKIEAAGIRVWYAPRDVDLKDYASSIVSAIDACTHFVVILSKDSLASEHVLNEIDLAFQKLGDGVRFAPIKIDEEEFGAAFKYYLSRQHWMDAHVPPLERRLDEFVAKLVDASIQA